MSEQGPMALFEVVLREGVLPGIDRHQRRYQRRQEAYAFLDGKDDGEWPDELTTADKHKHETIAEMMETGQQK